MSLDFVILDEQQRIVSGVGVSVDEHHQLCKLANTLNIEVWRKAREYYEDFAYSVDELDALAASLHRMASVSNDPGLIAKITRLEALALHAIQLERAVSGLAD